MKLNPIFKNKQSLSIAISLLLHIVVFIILANKRVSIDPPKKQKKHKIKAVLELKNFKKIKPNKPRIQKFSFMKDDLFKDDLLEQKKLSSLKDVDDYKVQADVNYSDSISSLRNISQNHRFAQVSTNQVFVPFYMLDKMPQPTISYTSVIKYPEKARQTIVSNIGVVVELFIDNKGNVVYGERITSSGLGFEVAVLSALTNMKYKPALFKGRKVGSMIRVRFIF